VDPQEQAATGSGLDSDRDRLAAIFTVKDLTPENQLRVVEDLSTGEEFQDKLEDDLYEKKDEEDPVFMWAGRIAIVCLTVAFIFTLFMGCIALWKAVF
jgi:hypothetical protein